MTKLQKLLICLAVTAAGTALAALPPQAQRAVEFREIINSQEITDLFMAERELIDGIVMLGWDLYRVTGGACQLDVHIVDIPEAMPPGWVGARQFELRLGEFSCSEESQGNCGRPATCAGRPFNRAPGVRNSSCRSGQRTHSGLGSPDYPARHAPWSRMCSS